PMRFGPGFKKPSKKTMRLHRAAQGAKLFEAEEIRRLLDAAKQPLKAMLLLGINCGFGNSDCGNLPLSAVNLERGVIDFPRPRLAFLDAARCGQRPCPHSAKHWPRCRRPRRRNTPTSSSSHDAVTAGTRTPPTDHSVVRPRNAAQTRHQRQEGYRVLHAPAY